MMQFLSNYVFALVGGFLLVSVGSIQAQPAQVDSVTVVFEVVVPAETPPADTMFWAGSLNRWDPGRRGTGFSAKDFSRPAENVKGRWRVSVTGPKGEEVSYKYTRGSIFSVEEKVDYTYRPVRTVQFDRSKVVRDTVAAWHDRPDEALAERWPTVRLHPSEIDLVHRGEPYDSSGMMLYDKTIASKFFDFGEARAGEVQVPDRLRDPVVYYLRLAEAPPTYVTAVAGKRSGEKWGVYVDQDWDRRIEPSEQAFAVKHDSADVGWTGAVALPQGIDGLHPSERDSVRVTIRHAPDPPGRRTSSARSDAPDLMGYRPLKHRSGTLNGRSFHVSAPFPVRFTTYFRLTVDRDGDGTMDIGSGSNEVVSMNSSKMWRRQRFFIHPTVQLGDRAWEVASIDPAGTEIRLRPAVVQDREAIGVGTEVPDWEATTLSGQKLSASSLEGKYVLLDFWGSWCAPCVEAIPKLKEVYDRYRGQNFEIIGFAYQGEASLRKAMDQYETEWPQIVDDEGEYSTRFLVRGYPTYYLVNPSGTIVTTGDRLREEGFMSVLEEYLEE